LDFLISVVCGFWCDFFSFAGFLTIWWLNMMNFTTVLCKRLSAKELVISVPVYESITGNACFLPKHCFVCIDFLWICVGWCYGVFVIMKSITGNACSFPEHCFVCIIFFEFGTIGFSWKNSLWFYDFTIRFYDLSLFCIFRVV